MPSTPLILASSSPRRAELLREAGYVFEVLPSAVSEPVPTSRASKPEHWAEALSYFKARDVAGRVDRGVVLAADTLVVHDAEIFGKPVDEEDARRILRTLAGTSHQVITGVSIVEVPSNRRLIEHETTQVTMKPMPTERVEAYLASGLWHGKAGAYGIQDRSDAAIECFEGSVSNVMGLPVETVKVMLEAFDILPAEST